MVNIKLKWNKVIFDNVEVSSTSVRDFKEKIYEITGVPTDRQKLTTKGAWIGTLKDDSDALTKLSEGQLITLIGTADVVEKPAEAVKFIEDMTVEEMAQKGAIMPAGLANLGNTCYMNATVECLRHIPELRNGLLNARNELLVALNQTFAQLDRSGEGVPPYRFLQILRGTFPQFGEMQQGRFMQQDAEEFYSAVIQAVRNDMESRNENFNAVLGLEIEEHLTCQEAPSEPGIVKKEIVNKLVCNIQGGSGSAISIDHMRDSIRLGLEGTVEKHSSVLGRDALWTKKQKVASLPKYICFQFMRFFWKADAENPGRGNKCKILRQVSFPETIDMFEFCTEPLQALMKAQREADTREFEKSLNAKAAAEDASKSDAMDVEGTAAATVFASSEQAAASQALSHLPKDFTGLYELYAIVTHKGRSADSGHYIGWVKQENSNLWLCFDDAKVTEVPEEEILKFCGGGDREMAYLSFYRAKSSKK